MIHDFFNKFQAFWLRKLCIVHKYVIPLKISDCKAKEKRKRMKPTSTSLIINIKMQIVNNFHENDRISRNLVSIARKFNYSVFTITLA